MKLKDLGLTIKRLIVSPTAKNTYLSFLGNGFFSLFAMLATILVSRSLGPAQFGVFSVIFSFSVVLFDVSSLGLYPALVRFVSFNLSRDKKREADKYAKAVFKIHLMTALVLIFLGFFLAPIFAGLFFGNSDYSLLLLIVFLGMVSTIFVGGFVSAFLRGRTEFLKDALLHGIRGFSRAFLILILLFLKKLVLTTAVLIFSLYNWLFLPLVFFFIPREFFKAKPKKIIFERLFHFSKWIFLWALTASLHSRLDIFMLERMKGSFITGIYSAATGPLVIFLTMINSFGVVLMPKIASIKNFAHFLRFFKKIIFSQIGLILMIFLGMILAEPLILLLFGRAYYAAIPILRVLLLGIILMALGLPFIASLTAWGKTKVIGLISTGQLFLVFFSNLILIKKFGAMGAAVTYNFSNLFALLVSLIFYRRELQLKKGNYEK